MSSNNTLNTIINTIINAPEPQLRALVQALLTSDDDTLRDNVVARQSIVSTSIPTDQTATMSSDNTLNTIIDTIIVAPEPQLRAPVQAPLTSDDDTLNTIINAPEPQLRALVQALLTSGDDTRLRKKIVATYSAMKYGDSHDRKNKRKAESDQDVPTCVYCNQSLLWTPESDDSVWDDDTEFIRQECRYHPGELFPVLFP
jgi:hypothetical protein